MKRSEFKRRKQCRREIRRFFTSIGVPYPSEEKGIPFILKCVFPFYGTMDYILTAPVDDWVNIALAGVSKQELDECYSIEFVDNKRYKVITGTFWDARTFSGQLYFKAVPQEV